MSTIEKEIEINSSVKSNFISTGLAWIIKGLSSVRFGVTLLMILVVLSMIGMLIQQQNVQDFDKYYAELTPSQRLLYGSLGFFDIYHVWYFNALLLILSLNIVLASLDHAPKTWKIIRGRKLQAGRTWLISQQQNAIVHIDNEQKESVIERVKGAFHQLGLKPIITEKDGRTYLFGQRGAWNRLGYLAVHVSLLMIFIGGFLTAQFSREGQMPLAPGTSSSEMGSLVFNLDKISSVPVELPFTVTCTDIQQRLIRKDGSIQANNTIDWLTWIKIKDEFGEREGLVHLNNPYDYRGYRFFQASFISVGMARHITLRLTPQNGGTPLDVTIKRDSSTTLPDGTKIDFKNFQSDFSVGMNNNQSSDYTNPAAILDVTTPTGDKKQVHAFATELSDNMPVAAPFGGYRYRLIDFEKVPSQHVLSVQKDPGRTPFYLGGTLLILTLGAVFFFSHQRVWALVEEKGTNSYEVVLGGNTNRNKLGFEDRFKKLANIIGKQKTGGEDNE
jgi:cytochrome c biogenesis protein